MTDALLIGSTAKGQVVRRTAAQMLTNSLFEGASGAGKSTIIAEQADFLMHVCPTLPVLVLDGVGTLARDLHSRLLLSCDALRDRGIDIARHEARIRFLSVSSKNTSGLAFNILRLRQKEDDFGPRLETYQERVDAVAASLHHTTEESETFMLVKKYGTAALLLLVAAHRPPSDMLRLFESAASGEGYFRRLLIEAGTHHAADLAASDDDDFFYHEQIAVLRNLYIEFGANPVQFQAQVGSTLRHYNWLTTQFASYFSGQGMDYGDFHDQGGILLVESKHADPAAAGLFRRLLYGLRYTHILQRPRASPTLLIVDEQHGMKASLYADLLVNARNQEDVQWFSFQNGEQIGEKGAHYNTICAAMKTFVFFRPEGPEAADRVVRRVNRMDPEAILLQRTSTQQSASEQQTWGTSKSAGLSRSKTLSIEETDGEREVVRTRGELGGDVSAARTELVKEEVLTPSVRRSLGLVATEGQSSSEGGGRSTSHGTSTKEERVSLHEQLLIHAAEMLRLPTASAYWIGDGEPAVLVRHVRPRLRFDEDRAKQGRVDQAGRSPRPMPAPPLEFTITPKAPKVPKPKPEPKVQAASAPGTVERKKPVRRKKVDASTEGTA